MLDFLRRYKQPLLQAQAERSGARQRTKTTMSPMAMPNADNAGVMVMATPISVAMPSPPLKPVNADFQ